MTQELNSKALVFFILLLFGVSMEAAASNNSKVISEKEICSIISQHLKIPTSQIDSKKNFAAIGADDLDLVEIIMTVEDAYGIEINDAALSKNSGTKQSEHLVNHLTINAFITVAATSKKQPPFTNSDNKTETEPIVGTYIELSAIMLPKGHVIVFIPSLAAILMNLENQKGNPLTKEEVFNIRDKSVVVALPNTVAINMVKNRGYDDINPRKCWLEWQHLRNTEQ